MDDHAGMSGSRPPVVAEAELLADRFPVSYAIFSMARVHRAIAASRLAEIGLYPNQEIMLMQLGAGDGLSQKTLAATLRISHVTVAKTVARMEQAGLVRRRTSERDRRVSLVDLTDEGRALLEQITEVWAHLESATTAGLDMGDQRSFVALAASIRRSLDAAAAPGDVQPA